MSKEASSLIPQKTAITENRRAFLHQAGLLSLATVGAAGSSLLALAAPTQAASRQRLHVSSNTHPANWYGWEDLGGVITSGPAVSSWNAGRLDCFARGTDSALWHRWYDGSWYDWESLGGYFRDAPAAVSWDIDRIDC